MINPYISWLNNFCLKLGESSFNKYLKHNTIPCTWEFQKMTENDVFCVCTSTDIPLSVDQLLLSLGKRCPSSKGKDKSTFGNECKNSFFKSSIYKSCEYNVRFVSAVPSILTPSDTAYSTAEPCPVFCTLFSSSRAVADYDLLLLVRFSWPVLLEGVARSVF